MLFDNEKTELAKLVERDAQAMDAAMKQIISTAQRVARHVWNHPTYTPQQVLAEYGNKGVMLADLSVAVNQLIGAITGQELPILPEGFELQRNDDGTVTVIDTRSSSSLSSESSEGHTSDSSTTEV